MKETVTFGGFFRLKRMELRLTLREFCKKNGFDPGNISKIERDLIAPPAGEKLRVRYALALGLKKGTDDWLTFFDLAAAGLGQMPEDLKQNENLLRKLPLLFRTIRGSKLNEEQLKSLLEAIRKEKKG